jgi:hypothetical protein
VGRPDLDRTVKRRAMKLVRWVSFVGEYNGAASNTQHAGIESTGSPDVARLVAQGLRRRDVQVDEPMDREGWAYDLDGELEGVPFEIIVSSTDEVRPLVLRIEVRHKLLAWVSRRRPELSPILDRLCESVHAVLRTDPLFREVRWYTEEAWDHDPDRAWTPEP